MSDHNHFGDWDDKEQIENDTQLIQIDKLH